MFRILPSLFAKTLVFQHPGADSAPRQRQTLPGANWLNSTPENVREIFQNDPVRRRLFLRFLRSGCFGVFLVRDQEWVAYGWASRPGKGRPPHLPRSVAGWGSYWIFHCHTRSTFRGRGVYTCLLMRLAALALEKGGGPVYIDALPGNTPSLRAIVSAGFVPYGVTRTFRMSLPHVGSFLVSGYWAPDEPHPELGDSHVPAAPLRQEIGQGSSPSAAGGNVLPH